MQIYDLWKIHNKTSLERLNVKKIEKDILDKFKYSVSKKVCSSFSVRYYGKNRMNFLVNPIKRKQGSQPWVYHCEIQINTYRKKTL